MCAEVRLYPFHFPDQERRTEDAVICLSVQTDTEHPAGHSILLNKDEADALIKEIVWYRSRIKQP